ncbi:MAG: hypothetical protein AAF798_17290 [Bacteroidota bacterium]
MIRSLLTGFYILLLLSTKLFAQASGEVFSYDYVTKHHPSVLKNIDHYPALLIETGLDFLAARPEATVVIKDVVTYLEQHYPDEFIQWINHQNMGLPIWNKAVMFDNDDVLRDGTKEKSKEIKIPMVHLEETKLTGMLYLKWMNGAVVDGYFAHRDTICKAIYKNERVGHYHDVFRILDIAFLEFHLFNRRDIPYGYAHYPTRLGYEDFPDARPLVPLIGIYKTNGYMYGGPVKASNESEWGCCAGYFLPGSFWRQDYPRLPFLSTRK